MCVTVVTMIFIKLPNLVVHFVMVFVEKALRRTQ